jgi:hypothetical protein
MPTVKRLAPTTHSMEGLGAIVGVNYTGYRGLPVTAQNSRICLVPYSGIWLGNHTPCIRRWPYLYRLKRWAHQSKIN